MAPDVYSWQWELKSGRFFYSDQISHLLGVEECNAPSNLGDFLQFVHARDHKAVKNSTRALAKGVPFEKEVRLLPRPGGTVHVFLSFIPICDLSGDPVNVRSLCYKVTARPSTQARRINEDLLLAQAEQIANFGTWQFDVRTRSGRVSPRLADILGISPSTRVAQEDYWNRVHPDDRAEALRIVRSSLARIAPFQCALRYSPDGIRVRNHLVIGHPIAIQNRAVASAAGLIFDFTDQARTESELERLSQKLLRARDNERRNVARELHESTGQTLAALKMSLGRLREALPEDEDILQNLLRSSVDLAEEAVREIRTLSYLMHPPMLDESGLGSTLHWYAKGFSERSGISVSLDISDDFGRHGQQLETTIFRIVQEALTNVHRYSGSRTATIRLMRDRHSISAEVRDEGCGLPSSAPIRRGSTSLGVGIVGMRERVKEINGRFEIESTPGRGTTVRIILPLGPQPKPCEASNG